MDYIKNESSQKCKPPANLNIFHPPSAGTDFRRQILTSEVNPRTERVKYL